MSYNKNLINGVPISTLLTVLGMGLSILKLNKWRKAMKLKDLLKLVGKAAKPLLHKAVEFGDTFNDDLSRAITKSVLDKVKPDEIALDIVDRVEKNIPRIVKPFIPSKWSETAVDKIADLIRKQKSKLDADELAEKAIDLIQAELHKLIDRI